MFSMFKTVIDSILLEYCQKYKFDRRRIDGVRWRKIYFGRIFLIKNNCIQKIIVVIYSKKHRSNINFLLSVNSYEYQNFLKLIVSLKRPLGKLFVVHYIVLVNLY